MISMTIFRFDSRADAKATAYLLLHIQQELQRRFHLSTVSHELLVAIQTASRSQLDACIRRYGSIER